MKLIDHIGTDAGIALMLRVARPDNRRTFHLGQQAPLRWVCLECGQPCGCVRVPKGASVWCESCDLYDHATTGGDHGTTKS